MTVPVTRILDEFRKLCICHNSGAYTKGFHIHIAQRCFPVIRNTCHVGSNQGFAN